MAVHTPLTILCLTGAVSGRPFMVEAARLGARVVLLTSESLRASAWPDPAVSRLVTVPDMNDHHVVRDVVAYLAREERFDRVVPMTDQDVETAAAVREHLRLPGQSESQARFFRDKLAMRVRAAEAGIFQPRFVHVLHHGAIDDFLRTVPPPYMLKVRDGSASRDVTRLDRAEDVWSAIVALGDRASFYLLEAYVPGVVHHVDGVVADGRVQFSLVSRYGLPLHDLTRAGGNFVSFQIARGTADEAALQAAHAAVVAALGLDRGVTHIEFIQDASGRCHFLEAACRVAAARIPDAIWRATGVCQWHEWARLECGADYTPPVADLGAYGGVLLTVTDDPRPDLAAFDAPEIVWRSEKPHMPGLILVSRDQARLEALLLDYDRRFCVRFGRQPAEA